MDLNRYALFVDIASTKNFTKSGVRMGYTQSGVSHVLKSMEAELGFPLFVRTKHGVMENVVDSIAHRNDSHLTIATLASISHNWLPDIIANYVKENPSITLELIEGNPKELCVALDEKKADIAFISRTSASEYEWISLYEDPMLALLPDSYDVSGMSAFPITAFENQPFLLPAKEVYTDLPDLLVNHGVHVNVVCSAREDLSLMHLVSSGLGMTIIPQLSVLDMKYPLNVLPLKPALTRELGIAYRKDGHLPSYAKDFIELTQATLLNFKSC